ncbi:MAG TPA: hypothetical protein VI818_06770 [Candidatus Thermoplasmatota archaeon]|nr:hypothetical protein [Candidatus Thermoplasmatota archaeon]
MIALAYTRRPEQALECCGTSFNSREGWLEHRRSAHGGIGIGRRGRR